jgi:hypothetical protein
MKTFTNLLNPSYATRGAEGDELLASTWANPDLENHFLGEMKWKPKRLIFLVVHANVANHLHGLG